MAKSNVGFAESGVALKLQVVVHIFLLEVELAARLDGQLGHFTLPEGHCKGQAIRLVVCWLLMNISTPHNHAKCMLVSLIVAIDLEGHDQRVEASDLFR